MERELHGKVAIVTGGARGIGSATAEALAAAGASVVITDVLDDEGERVAAHLRDGGRSSTCPRSSARWAASAARSPTTPARARCD